VQARRDDHAGELMISEKDLWISKIRYPVQSYSRNSAFVLPADLPAPGAPVSERKKAQK
jgi:hypothetical protein